MQKKTLAMMGILAITTLSLMPQTAEAHDRHKHKKHHYSKHCDDHVGHSYSRVYHSPFGKRIVYYGPSYHSPYYGYNPKKKVKHHYKRHHAKQHYDWGKNTYVFKIDLND